MARRVALYARVSTEEQARTGYSVDEQLRRLEAHATAQSLTVVSRIVDEGYSGASPDRPGLLEVMQLAESGRIDSVLSVKRDRFFRSRLYRLLMDRDLEEYGVKLEALDDTGHIIGDGVSDSFSEWERQEITQRTSSGRREKARQGYVIAARLPDYGYRYNENRDGYVVDEERMAVVRRIFALLASGASIYAVASELEASHIPTPNGGTKWQRSFIRQTAFDDCYAAHTVDELRDLGVSENVLDRLEEKLYGVWWYNRRQVKTVRVPAGSGHFKKSRRVKEKPRGEWIAVPVPYSGVPGSHVEKARGAMTNNERVSHAGRRVWELSGGIARCPECGHALIAVTNRRKGREKPGEPPKYSYYYACGTRRRKGEGYCSYGRTPNADATEAEVWRMVKETLEDSESFRTGLDAHLKVREAEAKRRAESTEKRVRVLAEVIRVADSTRAKDQEMYRAGLLTLEELRASLLRHQDSREEAAQALRVSEGGLEEVRALRRDRDAVMKTYERLAPGRIKNLPREKRRAVYNALGVTCYPPRSKSEPLRVSFAALSTGRKGEDSGCQSDRTPTR